MANINLGVILILGAMILILMTLYYWNWKSVNPFCQGFFGKLSPVCWASSIFINAGGDVGDFCTIGPDCKNWSTIENRYLCCKGKCVKNDNVGQTCPQYCNVHNCSSGEQCSECTHRNQCTGYQNDAHVDCIGDKGTGVLFSPIKNGRCVLKDQKIETLAQFWHNWTSGVHWCELHGGQAPRGLQDITDSLNTPDYLTDRDLYPTGVYDSEFRKLWYETYGNLELPDTSNAIHSLSDARVDQSTFFRSRR